MAEFHRSLKKLPEHSPSAAQDVQCVRNPRPPLSLRRPHGASAIVCARSPLAAPEPEFLGSTAIHLLPPSLPQNSVFCVRQRKTPLLSSRFVLTPNLIPVVSHSLYLWCAERFRQKCVVEILLELSLRCLRQYSSI